MSSQSLAQEEPTGGDIEEKLFPILPYGFKPEFDMTGWVSEMPKREQGSIRLVKDREVKSYVGEILSNGPHLKTSVAFPDPNAYIGTTCRYFILHLKNLSKKVAIEVEVTSESGKTLLFRASNAQSVARLNAHECQMPLHLTQGWNKIVLDLHALTDRAFDQRYKHANRVKIFANCRIRRAFFAHRNYKDSELPEALKVFRDFGDNDSASNAAV